MQRRPRLLRPRPSAGSPARRLASRFWREAEVREGSVRTTVARLGQTSSNRALAFRFVSPQQQQKAEVPSSSPGFLPVLPSLSSPQESIPGWEPPVSQRRLPGKGKERVEALWAGPSSSRHVTSFSRPSVSPCLVRANEAGAGAIFVGCSLCPPSCVRASEAAAVAIFVEGIHSFQYVSAIWEQGQ